jgi:hypothetical protein
VVITYSTPPRLIIRDKKVFILVMYLLTMYLVEERPGHSQTDPSKHNRVQTSTSEHEQRPNKHDQVAGTGINKHATERPNEHDRTRPKARVGVYFAIREVTAVFRPMMYCYTEAVYVHFCSSYAGLPKTR